MQKNKKFIKLNKGEKVTASGKVCTCDCFQTTMMESEQSHQTVTLVFIKCLIETTEAVLWTRLYVVFL